MRAHDRWRVALLMMAARTDPGAARALLAAMIEVQPARAEAAAVLSGMESTQ